MNRVFIFLFLTALTFFQFNCAGKSSNDANTSNANSTAANQANANVAGTAPQTFTNADEAVAEGKKMLDALETEKAIDALKQAVKINPDLAEAYFNLGIAYSLVEKDEAEAVKDQVETAPTPKLSKNGKKEIIERTKNSDKAFENAVKAYKKFLAQNPKDDVAQFNLGRAYNKLNEDDDAEDALHEAVKLKPDDVEYQIEYGSILMKLAQYDEAVTALKKAVTLDPENLQAQDLLEKAEAGKKRVGFGLEPKPTQKQTKPKENPTPATAANTAVKAEPTPAAKKNTNQ